MIDVKIWQEEIHSLSSNWFLRHSSTNDYGNRVCFMVKRAQPQNSVPRKALRISSSAGLDESTRKLDNFRQSIDQMIHLKNPALLQ